MTNCGEPRPKQCHCNAILDKLLARFTNIKKISGLFVARNVIEGCRCYLGAAARTNFKFVRIDEEGFLKRCEENQITLSDSKQQLGQEVRFAGHIASNHGTKPDPVKVRAI